MRRVAILSALSVVVYFSPIPAFAYGALAVGVPPDVAKQGFSYAIRGDFQTEEEASASAINGCKGVDPNSKLQSPQSPEAIPFCTVVTTFQHQCAVVAEDPDAGTPGVGWAVAPTIEAATKQAVDNCKATAGESRQQYCKMDAYRCDTK